MRKLTRTQFIDDLKAALVHLYDSARHLFPPGQWKYDLLPVYGTTALLVAVTFALFRADRGETR